MGKFAIKNTATGVKFNLKASNGEIIATSAVYKSLRSCKNGIESVRKNAARANSDKKGEFRFRLKATNGEIIAASEGYKAKASCLNGIESVKKNAPEAEVVFEEK